MVKEFFLLNGKKILWFICQCIILMICIGFIYTIYYRNIYLDKMVNDTFVESTCQINYKTLYAKGKYLKRYRADFLVSYNVNGTSYQSWTSANGLDRAPTSDRVAQEAQLAQFDLAGNYSCWYNPDSPRMVVLVLRYNWTSTFVLFVPSVVALFMIYYIFRTLFLVFGATTIKTHKAIQKKRRPSNKK